MRATRVLALALIVLTAPLSRSAAQTCEGSAAFQDGRMRAGALYQGNRAVYDGGSQLAFGIPRSFYGTLTFDTRGDFPPPRTPGGIGPGSPSQSVDLGGGIELGYQIRPSHTAFEFCPALSWHAESNADGVQIREFGFGGNMGYLLPVSRWLTLVPAAGVRWVTSSECCEASPSYNEVRMAMGFVFNKALTIEPGLAVSSLSGTKSIFTIAVSINWWK